MFKTARIKNLSSQVLLLAIIAAFMYPQNIEAASGSPSTCISSQTCVLGEFIYDDSYNPLTTASCTLKSRYPDGSSFLDVSSITSTSDGWYGYSFSAPSTVGYYRTQLCCLADGEDMCIDKSFEVKSNDSGSPSASEIASAVWSYSGRTLSGFGSLVSNIWDYATRTLTGAGLSGSSLATKSDVESLSSAVSSNSSDIAALVKTTGEIKKTTQEARLVLEQLVNRPIIQNFIEDDGLTLNSKIDQTKTIADSIFINSQFIRSKVLLLSSKWKTLSSEEILDILIEIKKAVGEKSDGDASSSLFGQANWLKNAWGWKETEVLADQVLAIESTLSSVQDVVASQGKTNSSYREVKSLNFYLDTLERLVGDVSNKPEDKTLYGRISEVKFLALTLDKSESEVDKIITVLADSSESEIEAKTNQIMRSILAVNKIPKALLAFSNKSKEMPYLKQLKNKLLGLKALIAANRLYLAKGPKVAFANTWLEEGSVVFKSLITNPSEIAKQKVPLKYYLPPEVRDDDILDKDSGLEVKYDAEKNQYYVEGEFELAPGETKTLAVRVNDVWVISKSEIESLRKQADELSRPLEKTAYFAQGVTLKSDINVSLDKVLNLMSQATTPEQKIRAYRESQIELASVNQKMDALKNLVSQASSAGAYLGFVGGAQVLTIWGIVMVVVAGFALLFFYLKATKVKKGKKAEEEAEKSRILVKSVTTKPKKNILRVFLPFILVGVISSLSSAFVVKQMILGSSKSESKEDTHEELAVEEEIGSEVLSVSGEARGGEEMVKVVVEGRPVTVKEKPDIDAKTIYEFKNPTEVTKVDYAGGWVKIAIKDKNGIKVLIEGWVESRFLLTPTS